jgi:hypothetical protein
MEETARTQARRLITKTIKSPKLKDECRAFVAPSPGRAWLGHLRGVASLLPSAPVPFLASALLLEE